MVGEEKRHQMMQNLFGDQSEEEEEEEVESEHESNRQPGNASEEGDEGLEPEGDGEGEGEVEGHGEAEIESDGELQDVYHEHGESEGERDQSSQDVDVGDHREESGEKDSDSDEKIEYGQRAATSRKRDAINSGSERSEENNYADNEDEEVNQGRASRSPSQEKDDADFSRSAPEIRDVFGDSDDEEPLEYEVQNQNEDEANRSPMEEEDFDKELKPEDMLADEEGQYESEEEHVEAKIKEKPVGPPLELEIPLRPPPAHPDKMNMIKVSNIMGIDRKPFDPKTYVEEDHFVTDESGSKRRIRLENNIVRWRKVTNPDGSKSIESNARFVRWSDGSLQLLIGNEVLDISVQDSQHDQAHLFLRHGKGILQSQGRILKKMRFMPSSLSSNSHRLLTALVDSRHKKVYRVKNCITDIDPEREKEQKEKAESQTIRANEILNRKKEKVARKYPPIVRKERQLSPGFLEDALEEEDEDYFEPRRSSNRRRFEDDLELEARAERRIMNAKKGNKDIFRKSSMTAPKSSRQRLDYSESEKDESEYETEGEEEERSPGRGAEDMEEDFEEQEAEDYSEEEANELSEEEAEEPKRKMKESGSSLKRKAIESDEDSPPRKVAPQRRMAMVISDEED
ncbi:OLC1v1012195C1 [Oldenlandia corymbosa var. corymbosa]|uniref:OLC1v1012195C1 n=1 Tax=Oldenlandia corymbosa var. corymbosa TaxID=529605 RepID=A0AAV1DVF9_OLDCO|nr:OLC1v1012195C1 [Oldenlandia corymbosa var. corymbosa]